MKVKYLGESDPLALTNGKVYEVLSIECEYYRIVDETGEDYLYDSEPFDIVEIKCGESYICPVCGMFTFERAGEFDICEICGWEDDLVQLDNPNEDCCANQMSLNQARKAWRDKIAVMSTSEGRKIKCIETDGSVWTGTVDVYETAFDNEDDDNIGFSICVSRDDGSNVLVFAKEIEQISILNDANKSHHVCPVCGLYNFPEENSFDICPVCNWEDDADQEENPDEENGANRMSLNQAQEAWKTGQEIE